MQEKLLKNLLFQPTAPFREMHVARFIKALLEKERVPYFQDPTGNIVVGVASQQQYVSLMREKSKEPVRLYISHMDHPGFHGLSFLENQKKLKVKFYGGTPTRFLNGSRMWLSDEKGYIGEGVLTQSKLVKSGNTLDTAVISKIQWSRQPQGANSLFGAFKFKKPVWQSGDYLYTKAADDLVGVFCILSVALALKKSNSKAPFIGLLTRAEEVGFIGAIGHFRQNWHLKANRPVVGVSLETSRTLPGAEFGKGPVVRLGDRASVFDPGALEVLRFVAEKKLPKKYQRRIMDGGTCEATAATAFSIPTLAMSIPLGNYHNQSFEQGPESRGFRGPGPEFVHLKDIKGMLKICLSLMDLGLPWTDPWASRRREFEGWYKKAEKNLSVPV